MCVRACVRACVGGEGVYLMLHSHQQNDSCIKTGSDEKRFNVVVVVVVVLLLLLLSLTVWCKKSPDSVHKPQLLKREESRSGGTEPKSVRLPA